MMDVLPYDWQTADPTAAHGYITGPILAALPEGEGLRIADLGCGNGYLARLLDARGHRVCALDSSTDGIRVAAQASPSIDYRCLSLYADLPAHIGGDFDVVVASEVIEHLYDPRTFLRNAHALLRGGGTLILTTPYHGYLKNLALAVSGRMERHFTVDWDCGHIKFFSVKSLSTMVAQQGFGNLCFTFAGRCPFLWKSMIMAAKKGHPCRPSPS